MEKINIAELLRNCPQGMELDSTMYDNVYFKCIREHATYPIVCYTIDSKGNTEEITFSWYGKYALLDTSKCVIFPKGKTTWEGFVPPCKFKDGDVIVKNNFIAIISHIEPNGRIWYHCWYNIKYEECKIKTDFGIGCINDDDEIHFATKEEKEKLFKVIEDNGYKWNAETKTLEKLIEPKFKVGDKVRHKNNHNVAFTITSIEEDSYVCGAKMAFWFDDQDDYELVPKKFDITTLKPFDKVLVRDKNTDEWRGHFFSHYDNNSHIPYSCIGPEVINEYGQCIPFEGNEHLLGKTEDCKGFYKTWE